jgi:hypothetical protein
MQKNNWIGLRERDNFAYVKGQKPIYSKNCRNSLIISDSFTTLTTSSISIKFKYFVCYYE